MTTLAPLAGEQARFLGSHAASAAADDGNLSFQPHFNPPVSVCARHYRRNDAGVLTVAD